MYSFLSYHVWMDVYTYAVDLVVLDGNCVEACPEGYTVDDSLRACVSCNDGPCPKGN